MATLAPEPSVHNDELDPMGLTVHSKHSLHGSAQGDNGAPLSSNHQFDHHSEHPSRPHSKDPSHAGLAVDAQQPPPIPRADPAANVDGGDIYLDTATTAERIQDNLWLAISLGLAAAFWLMALVSQAIVASNLSNDFVRTAWFALILQLLLIVITASLLLTTHLPPYHIQISTLAAMVVVLGSLAADRNIYTPNTSSQKAMAAAWILTCLLDILFVLYFSSPPQHPLVAFLHGGYGARDTQTETYRKSNFFAGVQSNRNTVTGYPTSAPNRLSRAGSGNIELGAVGNRLSMTRSQSGRPLSGIPETTASGAPSGAGTDADDAQSHHLRPPLQQGDSGIRKSGRFSLYRREKEREREREREQQEREAQLQGGVGPSMGHLQGGAMGGGAGLQAPGSESMDVSGSRPTSNKPAVCRAEGLFAYRAASEDPSELSFRKGEVLEILDRSGKWWEGRREDGSVGIVPSNYLRVLDG